MKEEAGRVREGVRRQAQYENGIEAMGYSLYLEGYFPGAHYLEIVEAARVRAFLLL